MSGAGDQCIDPLTDSAHRLRPPVLNKLVTLSGTPAIDGAGRYALGTARRPMTLLPVNSTYFTAGFCFG
nr:MAG TPA: hypothetical protein [Caudoviricetes sp.]